MTMRRGHMCRCGAYRANADKLMLESALELLLALHGVHCSALHLTSLAC